LQRPEINSQYEPKDQSGDPQTSDYKRPSVEVEVIEGERRRSGPEDGEIRHDLSKEFSSGERCFNKNTPINKLSGDIDKISQFNQPPGIGPGFNGGGSPSPSSPGLGNIGGGGGGGENQQSPPAGQDGLSKYEREVIQLTNNFRKENGKSTLKVDNSIMKTSKKSSEIMKAENNMKHGYTSGWNGENIAYGQKDPSAVVNKAWINSPPHRKNMLRDDICYIGAGNTEPSKGTIYWTQQFNSCNR